MKLQFRVVASCAIVVGLLGWGGYTIYRTATATDTYTYRIDCTALPATDDALREWLASQPGVTAVSVRREGLTVVVVYTSSGAGGQPQLDPFRDTAQFGYSGVVGYKTQLIHQ